MKKLLLILTLGAILAALTGCPKEEGSEIVVIIEDPTFDGSGNGSGDGSDSTLISADTADTPPPRDTSRRPPVTEVRRMSLTAAVGMLERDLSRGDLERLKRHTGALSEAVSKELERAKEGSRKRTLNLLTIKLRNFKRSLEDIEGKKIPEEEKPILEETVKELSSLAERVKGSK